MKITPTIVTDDEKFSIAEQFLTAIRKKDWPAISAILTDDSRCSIPGNNSLSGIISGPSGVIDTVRTIVSCGLSPAPNNLQLSYRGFALSINMRITVGEVSEQQLTLVFTLRDRLVSEVNMYVSDVSGIDQIFGGTRWNNVQQNSPRADAKQKSNAAHTFLTAMKNSDWALMRSVMAPDIHWTLPGTSLLSGLANGVDAVINRAQSLKKFGVMFELLNILYGWDGVALSLHNTGHRDALVLDEYVTIVFELDGARVTSLTTHLSDVPGIEQFFVPGIIS